MSVTRAAIFVDCPSLWHGAFAWAKGNVKAGGKLRVDYASLLKLLKTHGDGEKPKAYVVSRSGVDVLGFKNALETIGYEVVLVSDSRTARERLQKGITDAAQTGDYSAIAVASDDPMIGKAIAFAALNTNVHWYAFGINQEGSHQSHLLGAEVVE